MSNIVELKNVTMKFIMFKEKVDSIKEYFIKFIKRKLSYEEFFALKNVTFSVEKGDVFGIVGLNGSGKSTILKIISGIMKPTEGEIHVNGTISPLIELGAGFDMDLTARENIFLNGSILGHSRSYMIKNIEAIIEFSELEDFMDVPIKNFSSGMVARLGFSIATIIKPDILIVDEILSVGDFLFQEKCEKRINMLLAGGTTVIIVSHSIEQIERLCNKVLWIEKGCVKMIGSTNEVCGAYQGKF